MPQCKYLTAYLNRSAFVSPFQRRRARGVVVRRFTEVTEFIRSGSSVTGMKVEDHRAGKSEILGADLIVNAAGPWAGEIAAKAGVSVPEVLP